MLASACSATAMLTSPQADATVEVRTGTQSQVPRSESFGATTFGNYQFRAQRPGSDPMYGLLPLRLSGSDLTLDILFFAPGIFLNLREAFAFYEFDVDKRVVRYRNSEKDGWSVYSPNDVDVAKSRSVFGKP
jgi:hypothetical protein